MADEQKIVNELQKFDFNKMEAQVYVTIVKYAGLNGSQISKLLNSNRGSVYSALNTLYEKGAIFLLPGETNVYQAQKPDTFIESLKEKYIKDFSKTADLLKEEFSNFDDVQISEEQYFNIKGHHNFVIKVKEMLFMAEEEVYINTNYPLKEFKEEIRELSQRNVRIILFSEENMDITDLNNVELYTMEMESFDFNKTMMLVIDSKRALIASGKQGGEFLGTFTDNPLMVEIVAEHIHYDIFLLNLVKQYGESLLNKADLKTIQEKKILNKMLEMTKRQKKELKKGINFFKI